MSDVKGTPYYFAEAQQPHLEEISKSVQEMRQAGRLTPKVLGRLRNYFRIKNIYNSNAIEGNILDVGETRQVVEHGLTITGKPLKDQAEAKNLKDALDLLEELARSTDTPITEKDIRDIHYVVLKEVNDENAGKYRRAAVEIAGSAYEPTAPESIGSQMTEFGKWLASVSIVKDYGAVETILHAAIAHTWFVTIHPFIDGNGRVARFIMNLLLMRYGYPIAIITKEDRHRYYDALEISQNGDITPYAMLVAECVDESLQEYKDVADEQSKEQEWASRIASQFTETERIRAKNEYEVWKSAMELLRSSFRQSAELLNASALGGSIFFRDFGILEFEKYWSLRNVDK